MRSFEREINETQEWFDSPRFAGIVRPYTARQVVEQRGTIGSHYTIAREAAAAFYDRLRELFAEHGLRLVQVNQRPLRLLGRETREEKNWWLVSDLGLST